MQKTIVVSTTDLKKILRLSLSIILGDDIATFYKFEDISEFNFKRLHKVF